MKNTPNKADSAPISEVKPARKTQAADTSLRLVEVTGDALAQQTDGTQRTPRYDMTKSGKVKNTLNNVEQFVQSRAKIRFNKLESVVEIDGRTMEDFDAQKIVSDIEKELGILPPEGRVFLALNVVARQDSYDPLVEHFNGLPAWDGMERLSVAFEKYLGVAHSEYVAAVSRAFHIGLCARAYEPGSKVDTALVLEGVQGLGKTSFVEVLGGQFYADLAIDPNDKDSMQNLRGFAVVELGELDGLTRNEISSTKRFLSKKVDVFRPSFGRLYQKVPRRCVFVGTSNEASYLRDPTGARRFWPVKCTKIDLEAWRRDRDQVLAEAREAYFAGEKWHLVDELAIAQQREETENRFSADPWEERLAAWVDSGSGADSLAGGGISYDQLLTIPLCLEPSQQTQHNKARVSSCMKRLGFEYKLVRIQSSASPVRRWVRADNR